MDRSRHVTIVFVADFADRIASLAASSDVWIIRTAENEAAVTNLWARGSSKFSLTLFAPGENDPVADVIDDIELHHGPASDGVISRIRVIGAKPTPGAETKLARIGLSLVERDVDGFVAQPL